MRPMIAALPGAGGDNIAFMMVLLLGLILPMVGLMISVASVQRPGGNIRSGIALIMFFGLAMAGGLLAGLEVKDAIAEKPALILGVLIALGHGCSTALAVWGMWYSRRKRGKWQTGRRRESWSFWLNFLAVFGYGLFFLLQAFPKLLNI